MYPQKLLVFDKNGKKFISEEKKFQKKTSFVSKTVKKRRKLEQKIPTDNRYRKIK